MCRARMICNAGVRLKLMERMRSCFPIRIFTIIAILEDYILVYWKQSIISFVSNKQKTVHKSITHKDKIKSHGLTYKVTQNSLLMKRSLILLLVLHSLLNVACHCSTAVASLLPLMGPGNEQFLQS